MSLLHSWKRLRQSARDYGWQRALTKASGRLGLPLNRFVIFRKKAVPKNISVIGCGQAAYATICFFIRKHRGDVFLDCYDVNEANAGKLQRAYGFDSIATFPEILLQNPALRTLFIASNHASHSEYAIAGLDRNLTVFCEKPLATCFEQLEALSGAVSGKMHLFHAGFNRPFSAAMRQVADALRGNRQPLSLHCVVHGHLLAAEHWYRRPEEGTRICGNMGHWIDLAVYLMGVRGHFPENFSLTLRGDGKTLPMDENVILVMTTDFGDLVSISLNARHEPFGGIEEIISLQCGDYKATIDDFRSIRQGTSEEQKRHVFPFKDVGHEALVRSVFEESDLKRSWEELYLSTFLTLHVAEMARSGEAETLQVARPLPDNKL